MAGGRYYAAATIKAFMGSPFPAVSTPADYKGKMLHYKGKFSLYSVYLKMTFSNSFFFFILIDVSVGLVGIGC